MRVIVLLIVSIVGAGVWAGTYTGMMQDEPMQCSANRPVDIELPPIYYVFDSDTKEIIFLDCIVDSLPPMYPDTTNKMMIDTVPMVPMYPDTSFVLGLRKSYGRPHIDSVYVLPHDTIINERWCGTYADGECVEWLVYCDTLLVPGHWQRIVKRNGRWEYVK